MLFITPTSGTANIKRRVRLRSPWSCRSTGLALNASSLPPSLTRPLEENWKKSSQAPSGHPLILSLAGKRRETHSAPHRLKSDFCTSSWPLGQSSALVPRRHCPLSGASYKENSSCPQPHIFPVTADYIGFLEGQGWRQHTVGEG